MHHIWKSLLWYFTSASIVSPCMKGPVRGRDWLGGLGAWNRAYKILFCFQYQGLIPPSNVRTSPFACSFPLSPVWSRTGGELKEKNLEKKWMGQEKDGLIGEGKNGEKKGLNSTKGFTHSLPWAEQWPDYLGKESLERPPASFIAEQGY